MRIFRTFEEARSEIRRDLAEMGIRVDNQQMQDKVGSFPTMELLNYGYTVTQGLPEQLNPTQPWALNEWEDRLNGIHGNPSPLGTAWSSRADEHMDWEQYLEYDGQPIETGLKLGDCIAINPAAKDDPLRFAYTYGERLALNDQLLRVIRELRVNPNSRQLYVSMWDPDVDSERIGNRRVPCSLGWHFLMRNDQLHTTYTMRSCDFVTHWENDCWLALQLQRYVANRTNNAVGQFSQFVNSLHVYQKDVAEVF